MTTCMQIKIEEAIVSGKAAEAQFRGIITTLPDLVSHLFAAQSVTFSFFKIIVVNLPQ